MGLAECYVSCNRIQAFFELSEQWEKKIITVSKTSNKSLEAIRLEDVTCHWNYGFDNHPTKMDEVDDLMLTANTNASIAISNVSYTFQKGNIYFVVGQVGSGKSALLQAIAGELPTKSGSITPCVDFIAYAAQDPWIMNGTVRDNITMGRSYDEEWYSKVIQACALGPDMAAFKYGDTTLLGDRGVQCSGGQRARIGLARTLYCDADLYLLDDPLSAVDAKVGRSLYYSAIEELALKRGKCVILVTHQVQFVGHSNCIMMDKGQILVSGSYSDCVQISGYDFRYHLSNSNANDEDTNFTESNFPASNVKAKLVKQDEPADQNQLEKRDVGVITMKTWRKYGNSLGGFISYFSLIIIFAVTQSTLLYTIVVAGEWAEAPDIEQASMFWIVMALSFTGSTIVLSILRAQISFFLFLKSSQRLHNEMLHQVLRAKIEFFDTSPLGRILNRFSADVGIVDEVLPYTLYDFLVGVFIIVGSIVTAAVVLPFVLLVLPPLLCYFLRLRDIFVCTTRELKRLDGIARSPIYAMVSESMNGIATIRVNGRLGHFTKKFEEIHDSHTRANIAFITSSRWFAFQLDILSFLLLSASTGLAVLFHVQKWFDVDSAMLGLVLTLLIQISTTNFPWVVRQSAEVSNQMVAVERISSYGSLPSEAELEKSLDKDLNNWPENKSIEVHNLTARYRSNLPIILSNVSFDVKSGERFAIVGRTGSGKSSLIQSFLRIIEPESGCIKVGGVDISSLGLHKLRNSMAVIPQSPVLFSGRSVQENLDPLGKCHDSEIMEALENVQMLDVINSLSDGLHTFVAESGSNFSVGQRQLLCLARAILCKCQILILDEPTANIDAKSDQLIQKTLRKEEFANATIVMIAHRLQTISDFDTVLVMGDGKVLEVGSPATLLDDRESHFFAMMKSSGSVD